MENNFFEKEKKIFEIKKKANVSEMLCCGLINAEQKKGKNRVVRIKNKKFNT